MANAESVASGASYAPRSLRLRLAVASTQGAEWQDAWWDDKPMRVFRIPSAAASEVMAWAPADKPTEIREGSTLPDYSSDPADWGLLMERERVGCFPFAGRWRALAARDAGGMRTGLPRESVGDTPGEAVCYAVLTKHGVDASEFRDG